MQLISQSTWNDTEKPFYMRNVNASSLEHVTLNVWWDWKCNITQNNTVPMPHDTLMHFPQAVYGTFSVFCIKQTQKSTAYLMCFCAFCWSQTPKTMKTATASWNLHLCNRVRSFMDAFGLVLGSWLFLLLKKLHCVPIMLQDGLVSFPELQKQCHCEQ